MTTGDKDSGNGAGTNTPTQVAAGAPSERLDSWKEIAAYLKREARTIQRWEKTEGLPVHRHVHGKAATVYAFKDELDVWWNKRRQQLAAEPGIATRRHWRWAVPLGVVLVLAIGGVLSRNRAHSKPPTIQNALRGRLLANSTSEDHRVAWIGVGRLPLYSAITPDGSEIYISNNAEDTVSVINTTTNSVTHTIRVGKQPARLTISPDGSRIYVSNIFGNLSVIDGKTKTATTVVTDRPVNDVVMAPDGGKLYLAEWSAGLKTFAVASRQMETIPTTGAPHYLALTPDGSRLYINYQNSGPGGRPGHDAIDVLDISHNRFLANISGAPNVGGPIAASPDGRQVWASGSDACRAPIYDHMGCPLSPGSVVNVIRTSDNKVIQTLGFAPDSGGVVSFFPDGSRAIVGGRPIQVIDTATFTMIEALEMQGQSVVFTPGANRAYVVSPENNAVAVFDLGGPACAPPPRGLVAWWPGDGTSSDVRGSNHAQLAKGTSFAPGRVGQAFSLDGVSGSISLGTLSNLNSVATSEYTFAAWVKFGPLIAAEPDVPILERITTRGGRTVRWRLLRERNGHIMFCRAAGSADNECVYGSSTAVASQATVPPGRWMHVSAIKTEKKIELYLNGARAAVAALEILAGNELPGEVRIGSSAQESSFLHGLVDEVQWYNRALEAGEIKSIFLAGGAGLCYGTRAAQ